MKKNITIISIILFTIPFISFAALFSNLTGLIRLLIEIINQAIAVVASLALLFFFWGLANFILNSSNEEKKSEGRNIMIWGIVALFVMFSVWGLIGVLQNTFLRGSSTSSKSLPSLPSLSPSGSVKDQENFFKKYDKSQITSGFDSERNSTYQVVGEDKDGNQIRVYQDKN